VEVFLFEGSIDPPPRDPCNACPQYDEWVRRLVVTVDLDEPPGRLDLQVLDPDGNPLPDAEVHIAGVIPRDGVTDADGRVSFTDLVPGSYRAIATREGFDVGDRVVTVPPGDAAADLPGQQRASLVAGGTTARSSAAGPPALPAGGRTVVIQLGALLAKIVRFEGVEKGSGRPFKNDVVIDLPRFNKQVVLQPLRKVTLKWELDSDAFDHVTIDPG